MNRHEYHTFCDLAAMFRLPIHVNELNSPPSMHNPNDTVAGWAGVPPDMTMWPKKLQQVGYQTHFIGKADWGAASARQFPAARGFSTGLGYMHHCIDYVNQAAPSWKNDTSTSTFRNCGDSALDSPSCDLDQYNNSGGEYRYFTDLWLHDHGQQLGGPALGLNGTFVTETLSQRAIDVVRSHDPATGPLAVYYALHLPHSPIEITAEYLARFDFVDNPLRQHYDAMVALADAAVGNFTAAIKASGLRNTVVLVASDNGGPTYSGGGANNYPLKGEMQTGQEEAQPGSRDTFSWSAPCLEGSPAPFLSQVPSTASGMGEYSCQH
jgi:arylsulfatase I/J